MSEPAPGPRRILAASAVLSCAYFAAIGLFSTYAPLWYKSLGIPLIEIGWLLSLSSWTRLFAPFVWGSLADAKGRRVQLLRLAAVLTLLAGLLFLLPPTVGLLAVATFSMFCFNAAITPLNETVLAARLMTPEGGVDARRYGRVRLWGSVGYLVSVVGCGWGLERLGMGYFVPGLIVGLLLIVGAAFWMPVHRGATHGHEATPPLGEVMRKPAVRWFFASVFMTVLAHTSLYSFFSLYVDEQGYGKSVVGLLWGASIIAEVAWFGLQGRLLERSSLHRWLTVCSLVAAVRFALTAAFGAHLWLLVLLQTLHAVTFAAQHTVCIALVTRYFPGRLRGRGQALYSVLGYGFSGVLGAIGGGWLVSHLGLASIFWVASGAALAGALCARRSAQLDN
ncbi:MFS transporter [Pelomonas sp. SE-A7]|uniref:MFS transporter n=1 Tax=Pelomonas sp. SE-A7 TaxID=3054953 RepID=UPI00259CE641|nr:MFS transporter [Pelomonas sp. SE-A7]MDM4765287.1 MFS transporter [Pelomonas sp. SE-A7]